VCGHSGCNDGSLGGVADAVILAATEPYRSCGKPILGVLALAKVGRNVQVVHFVSVAAMISIPLQPTAGFTVRKSPLLVLNDSKAASIDVDTGVSLDVDIGAIGHVEAVVVQPLVQADLALGLDHGFDADHGEQREQNAQEEGDEASHRAADVSKVRTR
jgi:hypothetical protein